MWKKEEGFAGLSRNIVFPSPKMVKWQNGMDLANDKSSLKHTCRPLEDTCSPPQVSYLLLYYVLCIMDYVCLFLYINSSSLFAATLNFILHTSSISSTLHERLSRFTVIADAPRRQMQPAEVSTLTLL
jgi:hypothetical protein